MTENRICPYPGLRAFNENESLYFKGREFHVEKSIELLKQNKFLMLTGASGDGKSSMVFAGIVPNARAGFFRGEFGRWAIIDFRPERDPFGNFANCLASVLNISPEIVKETIKHGFSSLIDIYTSSELFLDKNKPEYLNSDEKEKRKLANKASNLLIIIDQFEELFTNTENFLNGQLSNNAKLLLNLVIETNRIALEKNIPIYIICTMRSDYIGNCTYFKGLPELIGTSNYFIPRLNRNEIYQVIEEPAIMNGNSITSRLVQRLLYDLKEGMDVLPVLQHSLFRIWKIADEGNSSTMDLIHYAKVGGMPHDELTLEDQDNYLDWFDSLPDFKKELLKNPSLSNVLDAHANELFETTHEYQNSMVIERSRNENQISKSYAQELIKKSFVCLTRLDEGKAVRNRATIEEISQIIDDHSISSISLSRVLENFTKQGNTLVRPFNLSEIIENNPQQLINTELDITHEALIRNWQKLNEWVAEESESAAKYNDLLVQYTRWKTNSESTQYLLSVGQFSFFNDWYKEKEPSIAWLQKYLSTYIINSPELSKISDYKEQIKTEVEKFLNKSQSYINRQKNVMKFAFASITVFFLLAVFGFYYSNEQKNIAVEARMVAKANELAMKAIIESEQNPTLGYRVAEEAYKINPTNLAKQALMSSYINAPFYKSFEGHSFIVLYSEFSYNSQRILSCSQDNTIRVWDLEGKCLSVLTGHTNFVNIAHFNKSANQIISASNDKTLKLWDIKSGKCINTFYGHSRVITNVSFSPDEKNILTCSNDSTAILWNLNGKIIHTFNHNDRLSHAIFFPDGKKILTASFDNTIKVWDIDGSLLTTINSVSAKKQLVSISQSGNYIVTEGEDFSLEIWENTGRLLKKLYGHTGNILSCLFIGENKILSGSEDGTAIIWNIEKNNQIILNTKFKVDLINFSKNRGYILTASEKGNCFIWDTLGNKLSDIKINDIIYSTDFSDNGNYLITSNNHSNIFLWHLSNKQFILNGHENIIWLCNFSNDEKYFATASWDKTACIWDLNGKLITKLIGHTGKLFYIEFSPDSKRIITASDDNTSRVWDLQGNCIAILNAHTAKVYEARFIDNNSIATCSEDGTLRIWDINYKLSKTLNNNAGIISIAISYNKKFILSGSSDNSVTLWNINGDKVYSIKPCNSSVYRVKFSNNDKLFAVSNNDSSASIWSINGTRIANLVGHKKQVSWIDFSHNNEFILTSSLDNSVKLWNINGKCILTITNFTSMVNKAYFSKDDKYILACSDDAFAKLFDIKGNLLSIYKCKEFVQDAKFFPYENKILTVSGDGSAIIWPTFIEDIFNEMKENNDFLQLNNDDKINYGIINPDEE